jgi:hypothetical protein
MPNHTFIKRETDEVNGRTGILKCHFVFKEGKGRGTTRRKTLEARESTIQH